MTESGRKGRGRSEVDESGLDIGVVGLDTSHAEGFATILSNETNAAISAVWDGGDVRDDSYVTDFCDAFGATRVADTASMIDIVDAVLILTANWDRHRPIAKQFLEARVPALVDKPIAGTLTDIEAIRAVAEQTGTPVFGGSAVPYHPSLRPMRSDEGRHDLFAVGYDEPFYYGGHLTDAARQICGADWSTIDVVPHGTATTVTFGNGSHATLHFDGPNRDGVFGFLDVGEATRTAVIAGDERELNRMYKPFLQRFLELATTHRLGELDSRERRNAAPFDAATLLLGVQVALDSGTRVEPDSPELARHAEDGEAFLAGYEPYY